MKKLADSQGSSSDQSATVAGVRGLDEPGSQGSTDARDYAAVDRLEKVTVTSDDLQRFLREGKLP
jgi:hypothetical protein